MRKTLLFSLTILSAVTALCLSACDNKTSSQIEVGRAKSYATAQGQSAAAVFLNLTNKGENQDQLIAAKANIGTSTELHEVITDENGVAKMRAAESFKIDSGAHLELNARGPHIMVMGLISPLKSGEKFTVTLDFLHAPDITVPVRVEAPVQRQPVYHGDLVSPTNPVAPPKSGNGGHDHH